MKKILRDTCIIAALMILTVFTFSIMVVGFTAEIKLVYLLSALALIVSALNYFIDEMMNLPIDQDVPIVSTFDVGGGHSDRKN